MEETCMETSSLVTQTGWNQHEALLTGKQDEARLELEENKSTLHTCICCVSLPQTWIWEQRGQLSLRPPTRYPEPCVALCASFEMSNIQVRTGKYIYLLRVRAQH